MSFDKREQYINAFKQLFEQNNKIIVEGVERIRKELKEGKWKTNIYIPSGSVASLEACFNVAENHYPYLIHNIRRQCFDGKDPENYNIYEYYEEEMTEEEEEEEERDIIDEKEEWADF